MSGSMGTMTCSIIGPYWSPRTYLGRIGKGFGRGGKERKGWKERGGGWRDGTQYAHTCVEPGHVNQHSIKPPPPISLYSSSFSHLAHLDPSSRISHLYDVLDGRCRLHHDRQLRVPKALQEALDRRPQRLFVVIFNDRKHLDGPARTGAEVTARVLELRENVGREELFTREGEGQCEVSVRSV